MSFIFNVNTIITLFFIFVSTHGFEKVGHLKPLGAQRESEGHIEIREDIPDPITFHKDYILGSKPVVLKGAAKNIPAFNKWTDKYMKKEFGDIDCDVEEGKKENRSQNMWKWTYNKFLEKYQQEDVYMVNSLRGKLLDDLRMFPCIGCGGYRKVLQDIIMWFSSGGTKSVLHNDNIDNINCLFSGEKELYMVDKKYEEFINFDALQGSYSMVDVDAVDLDKYPGLAHAPWWRAKMQAGDCLFIPNQWFHQVRSYTDNYRNMAVNIWFHHLPKINTTDCERNPNVGKFVKFGEDVIFGGNEDTIRFLLKLEVQDGPVGYRPFKRAIKKHAHGDTFNKKNFVETLKVLDKNADKQITAEEIDALTSDEINIVRHLFPMVQMNMEDEDDELNEAEEEDAPDEGDTENAETIVEKDEL